MHFVRTYMDIVRSYMSIARLIFHFVRTHMRFVSSYIDFVRAASDILSDQAGKPDSGPPTYACEAASVGGSTYV